MKMQLTAFRKHVEMRMTTTFSYTQVIKNRKERLQIISLCRREIFILVRLLGFSFGATAFDRGGGREKAE